MIDSISYGMIACREAAMPSDLSYCTYPQAASVS